MRQNEPEPHGSVTRTNQPVSFIMSHIELKKEDGGSLTALGAAGIAYAGIITNAAVGAELGIRSKRVDACGSAPLSSARYEGIAALTHLESARNDNVAAQNGGDEGGRDEHGGESVGTHVFDYVYM